MGDTELPIIHGDDGNYYVEGAFCDPQGTPVLGFRRLDDDEVAELAERGALKISS